MNKLVFDKSKTFMTKYKDPLREVTEKLIVKIRKDKDMVGALARGNKIVISTEAKADGGMIIKATIKECLVCKPEPNKMISVMNVKNPYCSNCGRNLLNEI